jgi:hypothetical protein
VEINPNKCLTLRHGGEAGTLILVGQRGSASAMTSGKTGMIAVAALAVAISLVAKDFALPLFTISMFGLFDRLIANPVLRAKTRL